MKQMNNAPRTSSKIHLLELPTELITAVLDYLHVLDLNQVSETCKQLREICTHLSIWRVIGKQYINFDAKPHRNTDIEQLVKF